MRWQYTHYILPLLVAAAISVALALLAWRRRSVPGAVASMVLMMAVAEWSLAYALRLGSTDLATKLFWAKVRYVGIVIVPAAWLALALQYTQREEWLTRRDVALLAIEPLITLLLAWTNEFHHLIWIDVGMEASGTLQVWRATYGRWFWFHTVYSYLLLLIGTLFLVEAFIRSPRLYRAQIGALLVGALAPLAGNVLSTFDLTPILLDLTPFGFTVTGMAVALALFRLRLLDIVPVARDTVIENLSDGVIALDIQGRVVDLNLAAQSIIGRQAAEVIGRPVAEVFVPWRDLVERRRGLTEVREEVAIGDGERRRWYDLRVSPLCDHRGRLTCRLVVLRDITERRQVEEALRTQKQLFESLVAVGRATAERPTLEATLRNALTVVTEITGAEHGNLFLLDESGAVTRSFLLRGQQSREEKRSLVAKVMDKGLAGWVARHRQTALVRDTLQDERWLQLPDAPYIAQSALAVPILSGPALLGVITLIHTQTGHFSVGHAEFIKSAADQVALALRNAQMYEEQRRLADRQITLYEVLSTVGEHLEPEVIAQAAVEAVARLTGWSAVAVLLPDEAMTHLSVEAAAGRLSATQGWRIPADQGVSGRAFRTAQMQHVPDVSADPDYVNGHPDIRSELAVPMCRGEQVLGVLDVASDQWSGFDDDDVLLAESLAEAVALALENAHLYTEARQHATDLTTLFTVTRTVSRSLALKQALEQALPSVLISLGFDAGLIGLVDPSDGQLRLLTEYRLPSIMSRRLQSDGLEGTLCTHVHEQREGLFISGFEGETPDAVSEMATEMAAMGLRACAIIPLLHREQSLGVMCLFSHQPRTFLSNEMSLLDTIGRQVGTAVANARLFQTTVSERRRLLTLIESSRDGIIFVGLGGRVLVINASALEFLHLSGEPQDWTDRPIQDMLDALESHAPDVVDVIAAEMARTKLGSEPPGEGEYEVAPHIIHWLNLPVLAGASPLGRLLVLRDVTEERLVESMREDMTGALVHDLRNPLTSLYMALQFLDQPDTDNLLSSQRAMVEIALHSTQRMSRLVNNILDVNRLESGRMALERVPILLDDFIAAVLRGQALLAAQKKLRLESDVPSMLPPAWADNRLIERTLENLVGNAIKFTPDGGWVKVAAQAIEHKGDGQEAQPSEVSISVSDSGPGILPELQGRLFQKFVSGRQHGSGSGLGLAFCKLVVEAHGGRIWVESEPDKGTTFTFTLPVFQRSKKLKSTTMHGTD
ncbi:MAG: GAF domain-containing protein [Anaerolineae bacterium]|nr:MAG: GAF domain-containing protein [Anaerolineae bacterium]